MKKKEERATYENLPHDPLPLPLKRLLLPLQHLPERLQPPANPLPNRPIPPSPSNPQSPSQRRLSPNALYNPTQPPRSAPARAESAPFAAGKTAQEGFGNAGEEGRVRVGMALEEEVQEGGGEGADGGS